MVINIITLFPEMFSGPFDESIVKRAQKKKLVEIKIHNLRDWAIDKRGTVDDRPYGGGAGMILMIQPIYDAIESLKSKVKSQKSKIILLTPRGKTFNQKKAQELSKLDEIILICGHYEGFDERIRKFVDEEISIGNFVLTGGEIPAMAITDAVVRLLPGVLKKEKASQIESFSLGLKKLVKKSIKTKINHQSLAINHYLEYPQYTRPENFHGLKVPKVLLSGNHKKISEWRKKHISRKLTKKPHSL